LLKTLGTAILPSVLEKQIPISISSIETLATPAPRPTAITVICVLGFLGALILIPAVFSDITRHIGAWYPPYLAFSAVVGFICMVGLWKMRRWAVFGYIAFCAINQIVLLAMGVWSIFALILPTIVIAISFSNISRMK
jgi:hypothetical protein